MERREPPTLGGRRQSQPQDVSDAPPPRLRSLRAQPEPRPNLVLRRLRSIALYLGLFLICILATAATFLMIAAPTDLIRDQIVAQVKVRTGRTLTLNGPTSFALFPSVGIRFNAVSLSAPPGMQAAPLMTAKQIAADVRLMPLLQREVVIERLVLSEPVFELVVDAQGRRSWEFATDSGLPTLARVQLAQASKNTKTDELPPELKDFVRNSSNPTKAGEIVGGALKDLDKLVLADTSIEGGILRYSDLRSGGRHEVRAIDAEVGLKSLASPLDIKGKLDWHGEQLRIEARLTTLKAALDGRAAKLTASISGRQLQASYEGGLVSRTAIELDGKVTAKAASLRQLSIWLGHALPPTEGFGPASLTGIVKSTGPMTTLDAAVISLDGATSTGTVSVDTSGLRPLVKANLRVSELDVRKYRDTRPVNERDAHAGPAQTMPNSTPRAAPPPQSNRGSGQVQSIEDLLQREGATGPQVRGFSQREGWSSEPLSLAYLGLVDAEAKLSFGRLITGDIRLGATQIQLALKAANLRLTIDDAQLYEGRAKGFVTIDATRAAPSIGANIQVDGVAAQLLLKDAAAIDIVAGKGRLSLALAGQGRSEKEIVETLAGKVDFTVSDGSLVGWNIPQMIRGLGQGRFNGFDRVHTERTDFSELAATFEISSGIATNKDLRVIGPLVRMSGGGMIELPARRLDYTVRPKIVASLAGQGAQPQETGGIEIPVRIRGPWDRPSYEPDMQSLLKDPEKIADTVNEIGKQLGVKGNLGDVVRRALGSGKPSEEGQPDSQKGGQGGGGTKKILDQLLR